MPPRLPAHHARSRPSRPGARGARGGHRRGGADGGRADDPPGGAEIAVSLLVGWSFVGQRARRVGAAPGERDRQGDGGDRASRGSRTSWCGRRRRCRGRSASCSSRRTCSGRASCSCRFPDGRLHTAAGALDHGRRRARSSARCSSPGCCSATATSPGCDCPDNLLQVADAPGASEAIVHVQQALAAGARAWRRSRWSPGAGAGVAEPAPGDRARARHRRGRVRPRRSRGRSTTRSTSRSASCPTSPCSSRSRRCPSPSSSGLLRTRLARGAVADLVVELGGAPSPARCAPRSRARCATRR